MEGLAAEARDGERLAAGGRAAEGRVIPARARELGAREVEGLATEARDWLRVGACRVAVGRLLRVAGAERGPGPARMTRDDPALCEGRVAGADRALWVAGTDRALWVAGTDRALWVAGTDRALWVAGTDRAPCPKRVVLLLGCALEARLRGVVADEFLPSLDALGVARLVDRVARWATPFLVIGVARPVVRTPVAERLRAASDGRALAVERRPTAVCARRWGVIVALERAVVVGRALAVR